MAQLRASGVTGTQFRGIDLSEELRPCGLDPGREFLLSAHAEGDVAVGLVETVKVEVDDLEEARIVHGKWAASGPVRPRAAQPP